MICRSRPMRARPPACGAPATLVPLCVLAALIAGGGCAGKGGPPPPTVSGGNTGGPTGSVTVDFDRDVQPLFDRSCSCHLVVQAPEGEILERGLSFSSLVGVPSRQKPGLLRVKPGDPDSSYLFIKIDPSPDAAAVRAGDFMPPAIPQLTTEEVATIRKWIEEGALRAAPTGDQTPPTFAGVASAAAAGPFAADLTWTSATDDTSQADEISYLVYEATASGAEDFSIPTAETGKGAVNVHVTGLSPATAYWFVVRARDAAGNIDANVVEVSVTTAEEPPPPETPPDFVSEVLPIFTAHCTSCHAGGSPGACTGQAALCLDSFPGIVTSAIVPKIIRPGDSAGSLLVQRIRGDVQPRMPQGGPFLSEEEMRTVEAWIDGGAKDSPHEPGDNRPPTGTAGGPYAGFEGEPIAFAAVNAADPDGDPIAFLWDFGDSSGATGQGRFPWHIYARAGTYNVTLRISDGKASSDPPSAVVKVAGGGPVLTSALVGRVCSGCHGLRVTLDDGRRSSVTPPGAGGSWFQPGVTLDARPRTAAAWERTVQRMELYGAVLEGSDRDDLLSFLTRAWGSTDVRTEVFERVCSGCHTAALALAVPRAAALWKPTVDRMAITHGGVITTAERRQVSDYLSVVSVGPPPVALDAGLSHLWGSRTCSACHSPNLFIDPGSSLPYSQYRTPEGARSIALEMRGNGCGQPGVMEALATRFLVGFSTAAPDVLSIDTYSWSGTTGKLVVRAWSSGGDAAALVMFEEDGTPHPMKSLGDGSFSYDQARGATSPGRIIVRSALGSYLPWGNPVPR